MTARPPRLVGVRAAHNRTTLILYMRQGKDFFVHHIDLRVEGAGLLWHNCRSGVAGFSYGGHDFESCCSASFEVRMDWTLMRRLNILLNPGLLKYLAEAKARAAALGVEID